MNCLRWVRLRTSETAGFLPSRRRSVPQSHRDEEDLFLVLGRIRCPFWLSHLLVLGAGGVGRRGNPVVQCRLDQMEGASSTCERLGISSDCVSDYIICSIILWRRLGVSRIPINSCTIAILLCCLTVKFGCKDSSVLVCALKRISKNMPQGFAFSNIRKETHWLKHPEEVDIQSEELH